MTRPKKLITLDARTERIATEIQYRQTKFGFSSWVRQRLIAWDNKQQNGTPETPEVEILRLERKLAERHRVAWELAKHLAKGSRAFVDMDAAQIFGKTLLIVRARNTDEDVVE